MTWIINDKGPLLIGATAADALLAVINDARSSGTPGERLRQLAATAATQPERLLADVLASNDQTRRFARFIRPLSDVETSTDATQRWFGWSDLTLGKQWPVTGALLFKIDASAEVGFEVVEEKDETDPLLLDETILRFKLNGKLGANVSGTLGPLSGSASAAVTRSLVFEFGYDDDYLCFVALADALKRIELDMADHGDLVRAFAQQPLPGVAAPFTASTFRTIKYSGGANLDLGISGKVALSGAISGVPAALDIGGKARLAMANSFEYLIKPYANGLDVTVTLLDKQEEEAGFNIGVTLGLSQAGLDFINNLLPYLGGAQGFLAKIDAGLADAEKYSQYLLKPGTALRGLINDKIKAFAASSDANKKIIGAIATDIFGAGSTGGASDLVTDWLSDRFDDLQELPVGPGLQPFVQSLLSEIKPNVTGAVDGLLSDIFGAVNTKVEKVLDAATAKLDENDLSVLLGGKPKKTLAQVRAAINVIRSKIGKIISGISDLQTNFLRIAYAYDYQQSRSTKQSAQIRFATQGSDEWRRLIVDAGHTLSGIIDRHVSGQAQAAGVTVLDARFNQTLRRARTGSLDISLLTFTAGAASSHITELDVEVTESGVIIGLQSEISRRTHWFKAARAIEVSDFLGLGTAETARLDLTLSQEENWKSGEVRLFLESFDDCGVPINDTSLTDLRAHHEKCKGNGKSVSGRITAQLSLPPEVADRVAERAGDFLAEIRAMAPRKLFENKQMQDLVKSILENSVLTALQLKEKDLVKVSPNTFFFDSDGDLAINWNNIMQSGDDKWITLFEKSLGKPSSGIGNVQPDSKIRNKIKALRSAYTSCDKLISFFSNLTQARTILRGATTATYRQVAEKVVDLHDAGLASLNDWVNIHLPIGTEVPPMPVALFNILQDVAVLCGRTTRPPIMFSMKFKDSKPFIRFDQSREPV